MTSCGLVKFEKAIVHILFILGFCKYIWNSYYLRVVTCSNIMHLSMSSPTTPRVGHIGGNVGICTSGLSNPHPLGGFRINIPQLIDK